MGILELGDFCEVERSVDGRVCRLNVVFGLKSNSLKVEGSFGMLKSFEYRRKLCGETEENQNPGFVVYHDCAS